MDNLVAEFNKIERKVSTLNTKQYYFVGQVF